MRFLDRIRSNRPPKSPKEADRLALRQLAMLGADLSRPRHIIHFLLFADEADARTAEEEIGQGSWSTRIEPPTETLAEWSLRVDGDRIVGAETIAAFRAQFEQLAESHGGEYDGWEASAKP